MTLEGPRVLGKLLQGAKATTNGAGTTFALLEGEGWSELDTATAGLPNLPSAVQRTYFDLSGYNREDLTQFYNAVEIQPAKKPNLPASGIVNEWVILSTEYIDDDEIYRWLDYTALLPAGRIGGGSGPGFTQSTLNQEQIVYGRFRQWYEVTTAGSVLGLQDTSLFGTCTASTADKIHITRIFTIVGGGLYLANSDINVVLGITVAREDELPYLMRMKRSYELATGP